MNKQTRFTTKFLGTLLIMSSLGSWFIPAANAAEKSIKTKAKTILWVDSYNKGFPWSDGTEAGIRKSLSESGIRLEIIRMDAKHKPGKDDQLAAGELVRKRVETLHPNLIIASDDPAQAYVVLPHLLNHKIPIVFTGVNWDATPYGYPRPGITGMIEVDAIDTLVRHLKSLAKGQRFALLAADNISELKSIEHYTKPGQLLSAGAIVATVKSYEEFQQKFLELQKDVDAIVLLDFSSLPNWDYDKASSWLGQNTDIPTGALKEWHAKMALITVAKIAEEQGIFAGKTAIRILNGSTPESFPIVSNQLYRLYLNKPMAERLKITFPLTLLRAASRASISP